MTNVFFFYIISTFCQQCLCTTMSFYTTVSFHTPSRVLGPWFSKTLPIFFQDLLQPKPLSSLVQYLFQILEEDLLRPHPEAGIPQHLWCWWEGTRGFSLPCPTNPCTCHSMADPPTERSCISSWNRSETSGRDSFQSDSAAGRGAGNRNTATASTS